MRFAAHVCANMRLVAVCAWFILPTLTLSVQSPRSKGDRHFEFYSNIGPDFAYGGNVNGFLQPFDPNLRMPWDFMDVKTGLALRVMNASLDGLAKTNVYHQGESMFLQIWASALPSQELYVHSCYAGPSPDPAAKSKLALVLNKGCVASKQSVVIFISRKSNEINLLVNTSTLKFPQVYIHCSVILTRYGLTADSKSCNYNESQSRWVELSGQTNVCDCCATKCRGPPYYEGLINEFKAVLSTGPLVIKEQKSINQVTVADSQISASAVTTGSIMAGASPPSTGKGLIVAGASVSGSKKNGYYNSPWPQPAESVMVISQDLGGTLSLWLPGLVMDVQSNPAMEIGFGFPQQKGVAKLVGVPSQSSAPTKNQFPGDMWKDSYKMLPDLNSLNYGIVGNEFVADAPYVTGTGLIGDISDSKDLQKRDEDLRGDVFVNFEEPQVVPPNEKSVLDQADSELLAGVLPKAQKNSEGKEEERVVFTQTEMLFKGITGDVSEQPDSINRIQLTIAQATNGPSSLTYEEEQRTPTLGQSDIKMTRLDLKTSKAGDRGKVERVKEVDLKKQLVQSLLALLRGQKRTP